MGKSIDIVEGFATIKNTAVIFHSGVLYENLLVQNLRQEHGPLNLPPGPVVVNIVTPNLPVSLDALAIEDGLQLMGGFQHFVFPSTLTYANIVDGRTVTYCRSDEQPGMHNVNISNNTFSVEKGSDKKIITVTGTSINPGGTYQTGILRQDTYNSKPYTLSGYFKSTNFFGNIDFCIAEFVFSHPSES